MLWFGKGEPTMSALSIRDDIGSGELRRRARRESDGRVSARLIAIANVLEGMASTANLALADCTVPHSLPRWSGDPRHARSGARPAAPRSPDP
jgi:hypothetical protein